jgi:hypothetical protein
MHIRIVGPALISYGEIIIWASLNGCCYPNLVVSNTNMANALTYELGATLSPFNIGSYNEYDSKLRNNKMAAVRTFSFSFQFVIANKPLELGIRNVL